MEQHERTKILIVGGGVAALEAALALRALAAGLVDVEIVAPEADFTYRPLLTAAPFASDELRTFPLRRLAKAAGAGFREAIVTGVDSDSHVVRTAAGDLLGFDLALLAPGAAPVVAVPGAVAFRGPREAQALTGILLEAAEGIVDSIVFALPSGAGWPLPLYELALQTRAYLVDEGSPGVRISLVTPEDEPLGLFGSRASEAVRELLDARGIELVTHATPISFADGRLSVAPSRTIHADRAVSLPRLEGPHLLGVIHDPNGFIPTDRHCQVADEIDVWAAGDATRFPLKQGGVATQQADAAAEAMAARAGAPIEPQPFRPVLRGLLLTGMVPRFLRAETATGASEIDTEPLWWPPAKIVGRHLAPFLAKQLGLSDVLPDAARHAALPVEVELAGAGAWAEV